MAKYIDGYAFPISRDDLEIYEAAALSIAQIWKEHGAIDYKEFIQDNTEIDGVKAFPNILESKNNEVIIFGWVAFKSKEVRDRAHQLVSHDPRIPELVKPLNNPSKIILMPPVWYVVDLKRLSNSLNAKSNKCKILLSSFPIVTF